MYMYMCSPAGYMTYKGHLSKYYISSIEMSCVENFWDILYLWKRHFVSLRIEPLVRVVVPTEEAGEGICTRVFCDIR